MGIKNLIKKQNELNLKKTTYNYYETIGKLKQEILFENKTIHLKK